VKQHEAVIKVMEENGGFATLGRLYQNVLKVPGCSWGTKTPFATIRRIVQDPRFFFKIRPGLWALNSARDTLPPEILPRHTQSRTEQAEYSHTYYQGLLVELGNLQRFKTSVPRQDKNKLFLGNKLSEVTSMEDMRDFTYDRLVRIARTIDVVWFNDRDMPASLLEVEHSTPISNSLLKFVELQDFNSDLRIVADAARSREFRDKLGLDAFRPVSKRVEFWSYDDVVELHSRKSALAGIESKLGLSGQREK
jgi:hypothetical protein